jgi:hypothetical protein
MTTGGEIAAEVKLKNPAIEWRKTNMGEQLSNKRGLKSSAQKERARNQYAETPASNQVGGAHGKTKPEQASDKDVALTMDERRKKRARGLH